MSTPNEPTIDFIVEVPPGGEDFYDRRGFEINGERFMPDVLLDFGRVDSPHLRTDLQGDEFVEIWIDSHHEDINIAVGIGHKFHSGKVDVDGLALKPEAVDALFELLGKLLRADFPAEFRAEHLQPNGRKRLAITKEADL